MTFLLSLPPHLHKVRLRRSEASEYLLLKHGLPVAASTLAKLASLKTGPVYDRLNRTPLYRTDVLDQWAVAKLERP